MSEERRDTDRVEILGDLLGEIMVFQPMRVTQISRHGAQIETPFPLQLNSLHEVRLTLGDDSIVLKARIVHSSVSDVDPEHVLYRSGVQFVEPSEPVARVIAEFVERLTAQRRGA